MTILTIVAITMTIILIVLEAYLILSMVVEKIKTVVENKELDKQLKKEWETKTGIYAYLNKK